VVRHERGLARGDLVTGKYQLLNWTGHQGLACMSLSADGRKMATGAGDGTIKLWDVRSLELEATLLAHGEEVTSLAWSPDGKALASHSEWEGTIRLWDMATRQELGAMVESAHQYAHPMFSSDGSILATIAAEPFPAVVLWPAPRDEKPSR
jgi:WD40 repeat protein